MRILVAHLDGLERSGGMSRLTGRAHDELERTGHEVDYLSADDVGATTRAAMVKARFDSGRVFDQLADLLAQPVHSARRPAGLQ
jgi:hypothetical protein